MIANLILRFFGGMLSCPIFYFCLYRDVFFLDVGLCDVMWNVIMSNFLLLSLQRWTFLDVMSLGVGGDVASIFSFCLYRDGLFLDVGLGRG